jgi:hypothetical protein
MLLVAIIMIGENKYYLSLPDQDFKKFYNPRSALLNN